MGLKRHLSYANVTSTIALLLASGTGVVYAAGEIGSRQVANNSVRTQDLKDRRGVTGEDVRGNTIGGREIDESDLAGGRIAQLAGNQDGDCDPVEVTFVDCVVQGVELQGSSRLLAVTTGGLSSEGAPANATCEVRVDGADQALSETPGELIDNTSAGATDGFARTLVTDPIPPGSHQVALACMQLGPEDARIRAPTIAVIAVTTGG